MPIIGLSVTDQNLACSIARTFALLLAEYTAKTENGADGTDFILRPTASLEEVSFLLLSRATAQESIPAAETIWAEYPRIGIIYVAQEADEVFAALPYPFFHVARSYALEPDLRAALSKMTRLRPPKPHWHTFLCKNGLTRIKQRQILYLESDRHEIRIHCEQETLSTAQTLAECERKLGKPGFSRVHKSFLVNLYHVARLEKDSLFLDNGEQIYISRYRYPEVKRQFEDYIRRLDFMDE